MKRFFYLALSVFSIVLFASCKKEEPISLTVDKTEIKFSSEGNSDMFRINSNTSWIITGYESWLKVEPLTGEGDKSIAIVPEKNTALKSRECSIKVTTDDGTISKTIKILQAETAEILVVSVENLVVSSSAGSSANFSIKSNNSWKINDCPDWLELSSISGNPSDNEITITAKALTTNYSASDRSAKITVKTENLTKELTVSQKAAWLKDCVAKPTGITVLYNSAGFDWEFSSNVAYYYYGAIAKSVADRMTTMEKVNYLVENGERDTPGDNYISSVNSLSSLTNYELYTVAYDKDGVQGDLFKQEFKTKSSSNQPDATIDEVSYNSTKWYWKTYIGPYASSYYMWVSQSTTFFNYSDGLMAFVVKRDIERYSEEFPKILQNGDWTLNRSGNYLQIVTWGLSIDGNYGGYISRFRGEITTSNAIEKQSITYKEYLELMSSVQRVF